MDCSKASYLSLALLLSITFSEPVVSNSTDLISTTCNQTEYFDVCMSSLQSYPESRSADLQELAAISLDVGLTYARETITYTKKLMVETSLVNESYASECLGDCLQLYCDALDNLHQSTVAIGEQSYKTVNAMVAGAMTDSDTCENGFLEKPGIQSPLTQRNTYFFKLCSNSMAITKLLD